MSRESVVRAVVVIKEVLTPYGKKVRMSYEVAVDRTAIH